MSSLPGAENTAPIVAPDPVATPIIEADDNAETDSTFGSEAGGSSFNYGSISSSIFDYRRENGRTYHAYSDGKYLMPNDEQEQERMDISYHAILLMLESQPFLAPIKNPQRIVDMGTGTGIWALDVGDQYPEAHVIGIDLSPIQPKWTCPNVEFRIDDLEHDWVFDSPLDLVHSRLCSGNAIKSWSRYLEQAYKSLRPGGWVETQDFNIQIKSDDDSIPADSHVLRWHRLLGEGMLIGGHDLGQGSAEIKAEFEKAGFVNVTAVDMKLPISPWAKDKRLKDAGSYAMLGMLEGIQGLSLAVFTRLLNWNRVELETFLADVRKDWVRKGVHAYWPLFVVYGQKPESAEKEDSVERDDGPGVNAA